MKGFMNTLFLSSSWKVVVQDLSLFKKENDNNGSPTKFLGDDGNDICLGGRTANTSILSSPKVSVGDLLLLKKAKNDRFPTTTFGNDNNNNGRSRINTLRDDLQRCIFYCCRFVGLRHYKNNVASLIKRERKIGGSLGCRLQGTSSAFVKKLAVVVFIGLFAAVNAPAEIISAVSYNPSRMGDYVYLKVADKANLKGGIESNTMTVRSGGTVSASSPNLNYEVPAVVGASGSALDMPNTVVHGNAVNTYNGYQAVSSGTPNALLNNVYVNGGQTTVKNDSYISTLDAVNRLKQKAATLRANKLSLSGSEDAGLYDGATTDGFTLAGNDIPQPTSSHVNTGAALSNCTLKWEERTTSDNQKVKLLALANCNGATPSTGDCSNTTYKASHKSECCPSAPKTDTVCYQKLYKWVQIRIYNDEGGINDACCKTSGCETLGDTCDCRMGCTTSSPHDAGYCRWQERQCQDTGEYEYKQLW